MSEQDKTNVTDDAFEEFKKFNQFSLDKRGHPPTPWESWQAASQHSEREIERLKLSVQNWKDFCKKVQKVDFNDYLALENKNTELSAQVNQLCEAFKKSLVALEQANNAGLITDTIWIGDAETLFDYMGEALSAIPAQSLQAFENEVIERCAKAADEARWTGNDEVLAIRALKGQNHEHIIGN